MRLRADTLLVVVGPSAADKDSNYHLDELDLGNHLSPRWALSTSTEVVVVIHKSVDKGIDNKERPANRHIGVGAVPSVEQDCCVVIPMQEDDLALLQNQNDSIDQLDKLGQSEDPSANQLESRPDLLVRSHANSTHESLGVEDFDEVGKDIEKDKE